MTQHNKEYKPNRNWYLDYLILLEYGYTTNGTFMNNNLITNIKASNNPSHLYTNAVTRAIILKGGVNKFVDVWYDPTQMSNIFDYHTFLKIPHHLQ